MREVVSVHTQKHSIMRESPVTQREVNASEVYNVNLDCANICWGNPMWLPASVHNDDDCALIH